MLHIPNVNFVVAWRSGLVVELNAGGRKEMLLLEQLLDPFYRIVISVRVENGALRHTELCVMH
jgi:hypothetical protein